MERYSLERIQVVVAANLYKKDFDGRISKENYNWGNEVIGKLSENMRMGINANYLTTHPGLLNLFANTVREYEEKSLEKEQVAHERTAEDIAVGDRYRYKGADVEVVSMKGIYPDDVGISKKERSGGTEYAVTSNVDKNELHRNGIYLGNGEKTVVSEFDTAKKYIEDFLDSEYSSTADFSDMQHISIGYTEIGSAPTHTLQENNSKTVTLIYNPATETWTASGRTTIEFTVKCEPVVEPPQKPSEERIKELLEGAVLIHCKNEDANHGDIYFTLAEGEYVLGEAVEENAGVYTYTVTVKPAKYVEAYSKQPDINKEHTLSPADQGNKTITLHYSEAENRWFVNRGEAPVTYTVICENEPQKPGKPTDDEIKKATAAVNCTTGHGDRSWTLRDGTFTPGEVTGDDTTGYTCKITVRAAEYVKYFNENKQANGVKHTLADVAEKTFTMTYKDGKWTIPTNPAVTFNVTCETEPETTYTVTYTDGANGKFFADDVHSDLKLGDKTPAFAGTANREGYRLVGWYPTVSETVTGNATYEAIWTAATYTVTYTDGVDGEVVFEDQVNKDQAYGVHTPGFVGTPTRKNYIFGGWNPEVTKTVTADVTYTATWKPDFNNNGKDDNTEDRYTVTYKDGASGKVFKDEVHKDLLPGVDTPEFSGKLTRKGYTFAGWSPKVADTVTKTVTYTATWKATSTTGKDKVPKTGDSGMVLILGSVMFSFCGATAVYVFDRKRKQG